MITNSKNNYKQRLLDEIENLSESDLAKIIKLINFVKREVLDPEKKESDDKAFWESFGSWKDDRSSEEIIDAIYKSRKSSGNKIEL